jgi:hypothetical protein
MGDCREAVIQCADHPYLRRLFAHCLPGLFFLVGEAIWSTGMRGDMMLA